jgi:hypothetical protein
MFILLLFAWKEDIMETFCPFDTFLFPTVYGFRSHAVLMLIPYAQTESGVHPVFYSTGMGSFFFGAIAARAWSSLLTSIFFGRYELVELHIHPVCHHGVHRNNSTFHLLTLHIFMFYWEICVLVCICLHALHGVFIDVYFWSTSCAAKRPERSIFKTRKFDTMKSNSCEQL